LIRFWEAGRKILWIMLAIAQGFVLYLMPTALLLLLRNLFRARRELLQMLAGIHRIDRQKPSFK
jgi:hypothetical protein